MERSEADDDFSVRESISADCFADADVVYDKDKGTYTITNTLGKLMENKAFRNAMQDAIEAFMAASPCAFPSATSASRDTETGTSMDMPS